MHFCGALLHLRCVPKEVFRPLLFPLKLGCIDIRLYQQNDVENVQQSCTFNEVISLSGSSILPLVIYRVYMMSAISCGHTSLIVLNIKVVKVNICCCWTEHKFHLVSKDEGQV